MTPSPNETPSKDSKGFSITKKLREMATPTRSPTLRKLVLSSIQSRLTGSSNKNTQIKSVSGKNTDNLAGWMSSIRTRARLALLQDDDFEQQTNSQIERAKDVESYESSIENDELARASDSFDKLGEILSKKRVISSVQPHLVNQDEKRQKVADVRFQFGFINLGNGSNIGILGTRRSLHRRGRTSAAGAPIRHVQGGDLS